MSSILLLGFLFVFEVVRVKQRFGFGRGAPSSTHHGHSVQGPSSAGDSPRVVSTQEGCGFRFQLETQPGKRLVLCDHVFEVGLHVVGHASDFAIDSSVECHLELLVVTNEVQSEVGWIIRAAAFADQLPALLDRGGGSGQLEILDMDH